MRNSAMRLVRAVIVSGAIVAATSSPLAYAGDWGEGGGSTEITNINNGNTYSYQGLGTITLDNLLGTSTQSSLLTPLRPAIGLLTS
ncbi:hypothetical protein [Streptomyces sp. H27-S2]|uniref:hypothetical protein n=1 Tax=Streptomyces antarcticus TaxID=2996458 RepID=UPI0022713225|nr:hypothetical protein [Streptomyces sp. H27-S2]MCY0955232.1 hypothetical protein [Streptomyces sp. H27-S2]